MHVLSINVSPSRVRVCCFESSLLALSLCRKRGIKQHRWMGFVDLFLGISTWSKVIEDGILVVSNNRFSFIM